MSIFTLLKLLLYCYIQYIKYNYSLLTRIHKAVKDNVEIVDVDGSYLYKKVQQLEPTCMGIAPLDLPTSPPISGWEIISQSNVVHISQKMPCITNGLVYTYLSQRTSNDNGESTFLELTRGYTHWKPGCIHAISINIKHPIYCHIQSTMKPSMKPDSYQVWIMLQRDDLGYATVKCATCQCAAGYVLYFHISKISHISIFLGNQPAVLMCQHYFMHSLP